MLDWMRPWHCWRNTPNRSERILLAGDGAIRHFGCATTKNLPDCETRKNSYRHLLDVVRIEVTRTDE